jgi:quercetin dioxygenase-like cupin family protein
MGLACVHLRIPECVAELRSSLDVQEPVVSYCGMCRHHISIPCGLPSGAADQEVIFVKGLFRSMLGLILLVGSLAMASPAFAIAQGSGTPAAGPSCISGVEAQVLGATQPEQAAGYTLVTARLTFEPGGTIGAHTHPGTLVVTIESGTFGLTLLSEGEMHITRAGSDTEEMAVQDEETVLEAGDGFVEMGMVHSARNLGDDELVVTVSGLVEEGQPLTQCVE